MKTGILLLNLGGPERLEDVKPFLYNLFSDPDILVGIPTPFRQALALFISQVKGPGSVENYRLIGGGSPQLKWTRIQADGLAAALGSDFRVAVGMRAWKPTIADGLRELREGGAEKLVLFPLFPHFSTTTTGSCFKEAHRALKKMGWHPQTREINSWADHPTYIALLRKTIDEKLAARGPAAPVHVLLSAHSLPMKIIERGDIYPSEIAKTVGALTQGLARPWTLAFQSRNGPVPWLKPYTEDELARLGRERVHDVLIVPISFVSDHIETLQEIDLQYRDEAAHHGITTYDRTRSFNGDPEFFEVLRQVYRDSEAAAPA